MKKVLLIVLVLISVNCFGQDISGKEYTECIGCVKDDTIFFTKGRNMMMKIQRYEPVPKNSPLYCETFVKKDRFRKRKGNVLFIVAVALYTGLTSWFFIR